MWTTSHLILTILLFVAIRHKAYAHAEERKRTKLHHILENLRNNQVICMKRSKESVQYIIEMEIDRKPTFRLRCHCTNVYNKAKTLCYFFVPYEAKWLLASKQHLKGDGCVQKLKTKVEVRKSRLSVSL
ncbi:Peptidase, M16 family [Trichuris trichiura]|uniref:Peptidase, M16 family n=1 Tax=Trichuris trichiura TaxID=36087 RepID=A0A077YXB9_TRITR|nr:Peptidase, M16 family [Trichuris trichiura]